MKRSVFLSVVLLVLLASCVKSIQPDEPGDIQHQTFTSLLEVDGHEYDSIVIENCVFEGGGLSIGDADFIVVRNCTFTDIDRNGLKIGFTGPCEGILIENCTFNNIGYNAIDSHKEAYNCIIRNNTITNVALSDVGAAMAQPHHGIYWKGKNVLIEKNTIDGSGQNFGNAISIRSSGIVRKNVLSNSPKNGIMYFANHEGADSLIIENNFLIQNAYSMTVNTDGNIDNHNENVVIRFNSMIQEKHPSIQIDSRFESTTHFYIYGNLMVNPTEEYLKIPFEPQVAESNLGLTSGAGFIDPQSDLHLLSGSPAIGFCSNISLPFPQDDIDGELRSLNTLNAGADE